MTFDIQYLTLTDLRAKLGGRSRSAIYTDLAAGGLPQPIKLGKTLYWIEKEIDDHLRYLGAKDRLLAMRDNSEFAAKFASHDAAAEFAELNGWTLQTTEPMERGVWAQFTA